MDTINKEIENAQNEIKNFISNEVNNNLKQSLENLTENIYNKLSSHKQQSLFYEDIHTPCITDEVYDMYMKNVHVVDKKNKEDILFYTEDIIRVENWNNCLTAHVSNYIIIYKNGNIYFINQEHDNCCSMNKYETSQINIDYEIPYCIILMLSYVSNIYKYKCGCNTDDKINKLTACAEDYIDFTKYRYKDGNNYDTIPDILKNKKNNNIGFANDTIYTNFQYYIEKSILLVSESHNVQNSDSQRTQSQNVQKLQMYTEYLILFKQLLITIKNYKNTFQSGEILKCLKNEQEIDKEKLKLQNDIFNFEDNKIKFETSFTTQIDKLKEQNEKNKSQHKILLKEINELKKREIDFKKELSEKNKIISEQNEKYNILQNLYDILLESNE